MTSLASRSNQAAIPEASTQPRTEGDRRLWPEDDSSDSRRAARSPTGRAPRYHRTPSHHVSQRGCQRECRHYRKLSKRLQREFADFVNGGCDRLASLAVALVRSGQFLSSARLRSLPPQRLKVRRLSFGAKSPSQRWRPQTGRRRSQQSHDR